VCEEREAIEIVAAYVKIVSIYRENPLFIR